MSKIFLGSTYYIAITIIIFFSLKDFQWRLPGRTRMNSSRSHQNELVSVTPKWTRLGHTRMDSSRPHQNGLASVTSEWTRLGHIRMDSSQSHQNGLVSATSEWTHLGHTRMDSSRLHQNGLVSVTLEWTHLGLTRMDSSRPHQNGLDSDKNNKSMTIWPTCSEDYKFINISIHHLITLYLFEVDNTYFIHLLQILVYFIWTNW